MLFGAAIIGQLSEARSPPPGPPQEPEPHPLGAAGSGWRALTTSMSHRTDSRSRPGEDLTGLACDGRRAAGAECPAGRMRTPVPAGGLPRGKGLWAEPPGDDLRRRGRGALGPRWPAALGDRRPRISGSRLARAAW